MSKKTFDLGRFKKRKKANYFKAIVLIAVLMVILYLYNHSEAILQSFMKE